MVDKVIKDGKVAVLFSSGFGSGWSSWSYPTSDDIKERMLFNPSLVNAILSDESYERILEIAEKEFPGQYYGGLWNIAIEWVPEGTLFRIHEYDGNENVIPFDTDDFFKA